MWSTRSDGSPRAAQPLALLALLGVLLPLTACSPDVHPTRSHGPRAGTDVVQAVDAALGRRARFDRGHALAGLPVASYRLVAEPSSLVRTDTGYRVVVEQSLRLRGFDRVPVVTRDRYRFERRGGRLVLVSVRDRRWERQLAVPPQPWETGPVVVRRGPGVLLVLDPGSAAAGDRLLADVERAVAAVAPVVPYGWDRHVVVYALSDPGYLAGLRSVPGGDPLALDAVSYQVVADPTGEVAGTRVVLNPDLVTAPGPARDRLLRHELTHVALGERADGLPTWLSEGVAEYVSVRPVAPEERAVPVAAVEAARQHPQALPAEASFAGPEAGAAYGLAWWACEYVARTYGESLLWMLVDALEGDTAASPSAVDTALRRLLGIGAPTLARRSADLLLAEYD